MIICEFCLQHQEDGKCRFGLNLPKHMGCREFDPGIEKFCSKPGDFVNAGQLIQMATYFGIKGMELKKVKQMAAQEERIRLQVPAIETVSLNHNEPAGYEAYLTAGLPIKDETP